MCVNGAFRSVVEVALSSSRICNGWERGYCIRPVVCSIDLLFCASRKGGFMEYI